MKISKVEAIPVRQKGDIKKINDSAQDGIIIKVYTDEGIVGYGEVDSAPWVVKAIIDSPVSHRICQGLGQAIIGEDPFETEKIWEKMFLCSMFYGRRGAVIHAMSGIDIALWDIKGKALNMPICKLIGGVYRDKVRAYGSTLMPYTPQEAAEEALKWKEQGFTAVKMGWGGFELPQSACVKLVEACRNAIGDDMDLMLDVGFIPSSDFPVTAASRLLLINEIRQFNPYWIEEAVYPDDYEGYKMFAERTDVRIAGGENETTRYGFKQLIEDCGIDILQPDITRCGGLTEAKRIGTMALAHNTTVIPHAWSSGIVIAASLHFIASQPNSDLLEYCVWDTPIRRELLKSDFVLKDGYVEVPMGPGLGIELDDAAIEKYRCDKF